MAPALLQLGVTIQCPHGAAVQVVTQDQSTRAGGALVLLVGDSYLVSGCPFNIAGVPKPCVTVAWVAEARALKVDGSAPLLESSIGLCKSAEGVVLGPALVTGVQARVKGL
ncbi:MAG: hypothetical protein ABL998_08290 [Planctomycetota bacterium]